jgi:integrase/recombinase XerC
MGVIMSIEAESLLPSRVEFTPMLDPVGRIDLRPAEPSLDAHHLDALIAVWLDDCARRLPIETVAGYAEKIAYFRRWWTDVAPGQECTLRRRDLERFERGLRVLPGLRGTAPLGYNSRHDILRRLRQMFRWAAREHYTSLDYSAWVPLADGEPPKRKAASMEQLAHLFAAASRTPFALRDRAILALLIGTGIRRGECASLCVEQVRFFADSSGIATVRGKRTRRNRDGTRAVAFDAAAGVYLRAYIETFALVSGPLFRSGWGPSRGKGLTAQGLHKVVKRIIREAHLEDALQGCHDLRRAFATHLAKAAQGNEARSDVLRRQMGHATYRMTSVYTLLDAEDIVGAWASPMAALPPVPKVNIGAENGDSAK